MQLFRQTWQECCTNVSLFVDCSTEAPSGCSSNLQSKDRLYQHPSRCSARGDAVSLRPNAHTAETLCLMCAWCMKRSVRFILDAQQTLPLFEQNHRPPEHEAGHWCEQTQGDYRQSDFSSPATAAQTLQTQPHIPGQTLFYLPFFSLLVSLWCLWLNWPSALLISSLSKHHSSQDNERERARERR